MDFIILWLLPAVLVGGIGLVLFLAAHARLRKIRAVAAWPTTPGVIERSGVQRVRVRRGSGAGHPGRTRIAYLPQIEYSYKEFGTPFRSSGFEWTDRESADLTQPTAERLAAEYPPAKNVTVTYNPDWPEEAYLRVKPNTAWHERARFAALGLIALACLWLAAGALLKLTNAARQTALRGSAANLPVETAAIRAGLDALPGLACTEGGAAGAHLNYKLLDCRVSADPNAPTFQLYSRVEEPEKTDLLTALVPAADAIVASETLPLVAGWAFEEPARQTVIDWIRLNLPGALVNGETKKTEISAVAIRLENLGGTLRLSFGDLK